MFVIARVAVLTNLISIHRVDLFSELSKRVQVFKVLVSVAMENDRDWPVNTGPVDTLISIHGAIQKDLRTYMDIETSAMCMCLTVVCGISIDFALTLVFPANLVQELSWLFFIEGCIPRIN
jgi:hypothetical protein